MFFVLPGPPKNMPYPSDDDAHRPWPVPANHWSVFMRWHELLFMHWPVPAAALRPLIPGGLDVDTFGGRAWLGIVPFRMSGIRRRPLPAVPGTAAFAELNVRTYVTAGGRAGVWFFSLDAANPLAVRVARWTFHLPYFDARMSCTRAAPGAGARTDPHEIAYRSTRTHRGAPPAAFAARYRPVGPAFRAAPGTLEHFLTERYCLYAAHARNGRLFRGEIAHAPWPLRPAEADVERNEMTGQIGLSLPDAPPLLHYADSLDVVAWNLAPVE
jgi:uncharacterized protein YqjF (DUF2071 family)